MCNATDVIDSSQLARRVEAAAAISLERPDSDDVAYMHTVLCQVGLPRSAVDGYEFERTSGAASLRVEAGKLWDGTNWVRQPVPYGPTPRLILAYINTYAVRNGTREIPIGSSASDFLRKLGIEKSGGRSGSYNTFRKQTSALAAARIQLGLRVGGRATTFNGQPIEKFEAWLSNVDDQKTLWPGVLELSQDYFKTLTDEHRAVPLDIRAMHALSGSALALDIYAWLAHRLHRIEGSRRVFVSWKSLKDQFGHEYSDTKDAKRKFQKQLAQVLPLYPEARVQVVTGGIEMQQSPPPVPFRPAATRKSLAQLLREGGSGARGNGVDSRQSSTPDKSRGDTPLDRARTTQSSSENVVNIASRLLARGVPGQRSGGVEEPRDRCAR